MKCNECGGKFDTPEMLREPHGEYLPHCPYCGSDDIEETEMCPLCGESEAAVGDYCEDCADEIDSAVKYCINYLRNKYGLDTEKAIEIIAEWIEVRYC